MAWRKVYWQEMSANTSSSPIDSLSPSHRSAANSSLSLYTLCLVSRPSSFIFISIDITTLLLLLPLCVVILYRGLQQSLHKHPSSTVSHSDCFTYNMVIMELIGVFGYILNFAGICRHDFQLLFVAGFFTSLTWYGQIFFHILTCAERYLAVACPITYLGLRNEKGVRIRNASIGCAWLLSLAGMGLMMMTSIFSIVDISLLILSLTLITFCSLSALCVLIRPGPGEKDAGRERVDQSKLRAFYTILTILGVLIVRFIWNVTWEVLFWWGEHTDCVIMATCVWFNLPSSLLLPLLFLQRARK